MLFSEKNYKQEAQLFLPKSFITVTYSRGILQINFKKSLGLDLKNLGLPHWLGLTLWYIGLGLEKYLNYRTRRD